MLLLLLVSNFSLHRNTNGGSYNDLVNESLVIVIFHVIFSMSYAVIINYFGKNIFPNKEKTGYRTIVLISSVFTNVAFRLKSKRMQKKNKS